MKAFKNM